MHWELPDDFLAGFAKEQVRFRPSATARVRASPCSCVDPKKIPRRQWLYGRHYIRKFITETFQSRRRLRVRRLKKNNRSRSERKPG